MIEELGMEANRACRLESDREPARQRRKTVAGTWSQSVRSMSKESNSVHVVVKVTESEREKDTEQQGAC